MTILQSDGGLSDLLQSKRMIGWKVYDEMSHILVTTVMPVEWRGLW